MLIGGTFIIKSILLKTLKTTLLEYNKYRKKIFILIIRACYKVFKKTYIYAYIFKTNIILQKILNDSFLDKNKLKNVTTKKSF